MRNTFEHPITTEEIILCLREFQASVHYDRTGLIGDMRPILLQKALDIILTGKFDPS